MYNPCLQYNKIFSLSNKELMLDFVPNKPAATQNTKRKQSPYPTLPLQYLLFAAALLSLLNCANVQRFVLLHC